MLLVRGPRSNFGFVEVVRSTRGLIWRFRDNEVTSFGNVSMINPAVVRPSGNVGAFELLIRITRGAPEVRNHSAAGVTKGTSKIMRFRQFTPHKTLSDPHSSRRFRPANKEMSK